MKKYRLILLFSLIISSLVFTACESDDDEKMLSAQNCFNALSDTIPIGSRPAAIATCRAKLGGLTSPDAQLINCGLELWAGGLDTVTVSNAFDAAEGVPENQKEATLIANLSLTSTAVADNAYNYCYASGASGMIYVAGLIKLGTYMDSVGGAGAPDNYIDACLAGAPNACASTANGEMLIEMSDSYCVGESEENDVCQALGAAISANPSDPYNTLIDFLGQINF